jgi:hypothetical protein
VPFVPLVLVLLIPLAVMALMPLILIQRYRAGAARRLARPVIATLNVVTMVFSAFFFLIAAAVTTAWVPTAFTSAVAGMAMGCVLGVIGLWLSRWEATTRSLHYTPNRWLVLAITVAVSARVLYGFWRGWMTLRASGDETSFIAAFGVAGSLGVAGLVIGYYLAYGIGLRRRISKWRRRPLRVMDS